MTDIVERLRDRGVCSIAHNSCRNDFVCEKAADEIERLREALREISQQDPIELALDPQWSQRIARAALKETGHD